MTLDLQIGQVVIYTLDKIIMNWNVKLILSGKVFTETVRSVTRPDAKQTALARNPYARVISVNPAH